MSNALGMGKLKSIIVGCFLYLTIPPANGATDSCINGGVQVRIMEKFEPGKGRQVYLECVTNRYFFSTGAKIDFSFKIMASKIAIHLIGITGPRGQVGRGNHKAMARINLDKLPVNTYPIRWDVFGKVNTSVLRVNPNNYIFSEKEGECIAFVEDTVNKLPEYTIWGELYYASNSTNQVIWDFVETLENAGAKPRPLPSGGYYGLRVGETVNAIPPSPKQSTDEDTLYEYPFLMQFKGGDKKLQRIIDAFLENHREWVQDGTLSLEVYGDSGFHFETP